MDLNDDSNNVCNVKTNGNGLLECFDSSIEEPAGGHGTKRVNFAVDSEWGNGGEGTCDTEDFTSTEVSSNERNISEDVMCVSVDSFLSISQSSDNEGLSSTDENRSDVVCERVKSLKIVSEGSREREDSSSPDESNCLDQLLSKRHVFILSSAGKPVYTRYGSEDKLVTLFGVMQALVSVVQDGNDSLQTIECGNTLLAFMVEGPIILLGVCHNGETSSYLMRKLEYVYNQVVSILTLSQLTKIFKERHNYDLRILLSGSERIIDSLLNFTETRPEFFLNSIVYLTMPQAARDAISNAIASSCSKIKNLVFAVLLSGNRIVTIVGLKKYKLEPCDVHLIINLVKCAESFKNAESWTPICLPKFNPVGYLHAHVSYLADTSACLLLLTVDKDSFYKLSEARSKIEEKLLQNQSMIILKSALLKQKELPPPDIPLVRHFIYKFKANSQLYVSNVTEPYETQEKWNSLLVKYENLQSLMSDPAQPLKVLYQQLPNEVMFGWITDKIELYATFEPLIEKFECTDSTAKILQWITSEEEKLFMMNYIHLH